MKTLRVGTRRSPLAKAQTAWTVERLGLANREIRFETVEFTTTGDKLETPSLAAEGGKGLFVKELEEALFADRIDLAVHSAKDLPVALPDGLELAAFPERADPADLLVTPDGRDLATLPAGARVGTSSLRRRAQLLAARPDLSVEPLRGNVDTRLARLAEGKYAAVILAAAGIIRLAPVPSGWKGFRLPPEEWLPAPAQGSLAIEIRRTDDATRAAVRRIDHATTRMEIEIERGFLARMGGDCATPLGALAHIHGEHVRFQAAVWSPDGKRVARGSSQGDTAAIVDIVCGQLDAQGAPGILEEIRKTS